ncbi:MAG TPA: STAS/SEC14 domain-containing protein [Thermoleophilaceae bacterium]
MGIERLSDMPAGVLGFRVSGTLTREDYTERLIPDLRGVIEAGGRLRLVVLIEPDFDRLELGAVWEDVKTAVGVELKHHSSWERTAVVTDIEWISGATSAFSWLAPGELRRFAGTELEAAKAWAAGSPST